MTKKSDKLKDSRQLVINELERIGNDLSKHPRDVTRSELVNNSDKISDHFLRKLPGLSAIKAAAYPFEKDFKASAAISGTANYIKKLEKNAGLKALNVETLEQWVKEAIAGIKVSKDKVAKPPVSKGKRNMTMELLLSDWHIGKKTKTFDHKVAKQRLQQYMEVFHKELSVYQKSFNVERIVIANIGDLIESFTMHDLESAIACEFNNPEQLRMAIELLFNEVLKPVVKTGIKVDFVGVAGNHDRTERKKTMVDIGKNHMSWTVYHAVKMLSEASGYKNIKFTIPENTGTVLDIYGSKVLYEHGDHMKGKDARSAESHISKRSQQLGVMIDMLRSGHYHEYAVYGRGRVIINESLCGQDGFSETSGYNSHAGQSINYYIENKDRPNSFYHSFPVYLG